MERIEHKECQIVVSPAAQGAGRWGAAYRIKTKRLIEPIEGVLDGDEPTAEEAIVRGQRIVKVAINEAAYMNSEQFAASLRRLNERFAL